MKMDSSQFAPGIAYALRLRIARAMKLAEIDTAVELSEFLDVSYEAVRRELGLMSKSGLVIATTKKSKRGRPFRKWQFTDEGEHLFPKAYDSVFGDVLSQLTKPGSTETARTVLAKLAEKKSAEILGRGRETSMDDALRTLYGEFDEYISIEVNKEKITIVEKNCPILRIAKDYPIICSMSTNAISKTLDRRIVRSETFQGGDGRCVFVDANVPYDNLFVLESELETKFTGENPIL